MIKAEYIREGTLCTHHDKVAAVKELAIFEPKNGPVPNRPNGVSLFYLDGESQDHIVSLYNIHPIPITNKWLERFAFTWKDYKEKDMRWNNRDGTKHRTGLWLLNAVGFVQLDQDNWECWLVGGKKNQPGWMMRYVQYLHQIQNIFTDIREEILMLDGEGPQDQKIEVVKNKIITDIHGEA